MLSNTQINTQLNDNFSYKNFKDFSQKPELSYNKTYLKNAYGHEIQYINDDTKKIQNRKRYFLVAGSVLFVMAGAITAALATKKVNINMNTLKKFSTNTVDKSKDTYKRVCDFFMTWANLRDDAWDRMVTYLYDNTPVKFLKEKGDDLTKIYQETVKKSILKRIDSSKSRFKKIVPENAPYKDMLKFEEIDFDGINSQMQKTLKENRISKNLYSKEKTGIKGLIDKLTSPLADNTLSEVIEKYANKYGINIEDLKNAGADEEVIKEAEKYNSIILDELLGKLRDVNCGSAPNDIVCASIPILSFVSAVLATKDKEKRDSMLFNIGIPLIPTCLMPFAGLKFPILNGSKAMIAGFAVGQMFKQGVKIVDKKINGENELNRDVFDKEL